MLEGDTNAGLIRVYFPPCHDYRHRSTGRKPPSLPMGGIISEYMEAGVVLQYLLSTSTQKELEGQQDPCGEKKLELSHDTNGNGILLRIHIHRKLHSATVQV